MLFAGDKASVGEHVEVLHDGWQGDWEGLSELTDGDLGLLTKASEHGAPGGVGKRTEGAVEAAGLILNH